MLKIGCFFSPRSSLEATYVYKVCLEDVFKLVEQFMLVKMMTWRQLQTHRILMLENANAFLRMQSRWFFLQFNRFTSCEDILQLTPPGAENYKWSHPSHPSFSEEFSKCPTPNNLYVVFQEGLMEFRVPFMFVDFTLLDPFSMWFICSTWHDFGCQASAVLPFCNPDL